MHKNYPLTEAQYNIWVDQQVNLSSSLYNIGGFLNIYGEVNHSLFIKAHNNIIQRNDALRLVFSSDEKGEPYQIFKPHTPVDIPLMDFSSGEKPCEEAREWILKDFKIPFNTEECLYQFILMKISDEHYLYYTKYHHLIIDGWAGSLVITQVNNEYAALCSDEGINTAFDEYSYIRCIEDGLAYRDSQRFKESREFWEKKFEKRPPSLLSSPLFTPPVTSHGECLRVTRRMGKEEFDRIKNAASSLKVSLGNLFPGLLALYLNRVTGFEEIVLGLPLLNRTGKSFKKTVGLFVDTIPLSLVVDSTRSVPEIVKQVKSSLSSSYRYQRYPASLIEKAAGTHSGNRLFEVIFSHERHSFEDKFAGMETLGITLPPFAQNNALTLHLEEYEEGGSLHFDYRPDVFTEFTIEQFRDQFFEMIEDFLTNPEVSGRELNILPPTEKELLTETFNETEREFKVRTIIDCFEECVLKNPEAPALFFKGKTYSYREINARANYTACKLKELYNPGDGDAVALMADRSPQLIIALLGILKTGAAYVPIDPSYPKERVDYILEDARPKALISSENLKELTSSEGGVPPQREVTGASPVYIIYTSGTTGKPKGAVLNNNNFFNYISWAGDFYLNEKTRGDFPLFTSLSFDLTATSLFLPLLNGKSLTMYPQDGEISEILNSIFTDPRIDCVKLTPSHISLLREISIKGSSVSLAIVGGEELLKEQVQILKTINPSMEVINEYGPTETTVGCIVKAVDTGDEKVLIGKPIANTRIYITDSELNLMPLGVPGEICIGGVQVAEGYLRRPELTEAKFLMSPFKTDERIYRSGDLGRWLPDGEIQYLGRMDEQVKIRGHRIEPGEIENTMLLFEGIKNVCVTVNRDDKGDSFLTGYFTAEESVDMKTLREFLRDALPAYMIPSYFVPLKSIPLTSNGKADKRALPDPKQAAASTVSEYKAPRNSREKLLCSLWQELLERTTVGVDDNFFELGGDSVKAIQIMSRLKQKGLKGEVKTLFSKPSVGEFALTLTKEIVTVDQSVISGHVALTPVQKWFFTELRGIENHYNHSLVFKMKESLDFEGVKALNEALKKLVLHHDALRMTFLRDGEGIVQENRASLELSLEEHDLRDNKAPEETFHEKTVSLESTVNLEKGSLIHFALFHMPEGQRLFITAHHLIVDGISWRILAEDLESGFRQALSGKEIQLPLKTVSFQEWSENLPELKEGELPADTLPAAESSEKTSAEITFGKGETEVLLTKTHHAYSTGMNDVLLTALIRALFKWSDLHEFSVDIESHGRSENPSLDVSRTVGWFTAMKPVVLKAEPHGIKNLIEVKESLRKWDSSVTGGHSSVLFNYLGQTDSDMNTPLFSLISSRLSAAEGYIPSHKLIMNSLISNGEFSVTLESGVYRKETLNTILGLFQRELRELIDVLSSMSESVKTPSDLTLSELSQSEYSELLEKCSLKEEAVEDIYALTPLQEGFLFHSLMEKDSDAYFEQLSLDFHVRVNSEKFTEAWEKSALKHPVLRTLFISDFKHPVQIVIKERKPEFSVMDIRGQFSSEEERKALLLEIQSQERERKFDLEKDPLIRIKRVLTHDERETMILSFHHIILDGWSLPVLFKDFFNFYKGGADPEKAPLYSSYISWLQNLDEKGSLNYWKEYLSGYEERAVIPFKDVCSSDEGEYTFSFSREMSSGLMEMGKKFHVSQNSLIQTLWAVLLKNYNDREDVVFGSTVSGRPGEITGVEEMAGLFINTIPVRILPKGSFKECVLRTQEEALLSLDHHYSSLSEIQSVTGMSDGLFDHILVFENYPLDEALTNDGALKTGSVDFYEKTNFDLAVTILPGDNLTFRFNYNTGVYSKASVKLIEKHLLLAAQGVIENNSVDVNSLRLMTAEDENRLLKEFNNTSSDYMCEKTITELFEEQAERTPCAAALIFEGKKITYRELNEKANGVARYLKEHYGIQKGELAALVTDRTPEMVIALLGVLKAGAAYVPVDPSYPEERISYILEDAAPKAVLYDDTISEILSEIRDFTPVESERDASSLIYVIYTSGTTGKPKGTGITHRNYHNYMNWCSDYYFTQGHRGDFGFFTSISFDLTTTSLFLTLLRGQTLTVYSSAVDIAATLRDLFTNNEVDAVKLTPSHIRALKDMELTSGISKLVIVGGEELQKNHVETLKAIHPHMRIVNEYGPTETTVGCIAKDMEAGEEITIGKPIGNTQIYILNKEGKPVPVGVPGEIYIGGEGVCPGYINRPELTEKKFVNNPFSPGEKMYRSGDLGRWLSSGEVDFLGRIDSQVKVRGYRIELGEIENTLLAHDSVDAAVVLVQEDREDKYVIAWYVSGNTIQNSELRTYLNKALPDYMVPTFLIPVESLPLTPNGKVDVKALPRPQESLINTENRVAAGNGTEEKLVEIWKVVLGLPSVGTRDNFFDLGGNSLKMMRVSAAVKKAFEKEISLVDLYAYTTIKQLASFLNGEEEEDVYREESVQRESHDIAVIGISGRFPGASSVDEFWQNLREGKESISFFTDDELEEAGVERAVRENPSFIPAGGALKDKEFFDARFFGYSATDAEYLDPQSRILHEEAWRAMEDGGYNPHSCKESVGVFTGTSANYQWQNRCLNTSDLSYFEAEQLSNNSFLSTRISYKLDLRGPSYSLQTACSTSLSAVILACESLAHNKCDMALAGGATVTPHSAGGYVYQEGMIMSEDGHCRAFDKDASGTVAGEGAAMVLLKPLDKALEHRDNIYAVIKGYGTNNDGARKAGFTAPSVQGQSELIRSIHKQSRIDPETITYMETHGTGTEMGDPIEVEALKKAFGTEKRNYCALGALKASVGHLDTAAGVAGFIKTVLALKNRELPPSVNLNNPNPLLKIEESPFYFNKEVKSWVSDTPLRAGVSSFGMGGTNAHVVLEEAPQVETDGEPGDEKEYRVINLSARSSDSLKESLKNLREKAENDKAFSLADCEYTLNTGRKSFEQRASFVVKNREELITTLDKAVVSDHFRPSCVNGEAKTVFLFPGQGSQYPSMARELYEKESAFKKHIDSCLTLLKEERDLDFAATLFSEEIPAHLSSVALFIIEHSLALTLRERGVEPQILAGHSLGEYCAATLAGIFSLKDALTLVYDRALLVETLPPGKMISVFTDKETLLSLLDDSLSLAVENGENLQTVSGTPEAVDNFKLLLDERGINNKLLRSSYAFHSSMLDPLLKEFRKLIEGKELKAPEIPCLSNVTGDFMKAEEVRTSDYWVNHFRHSVKFHDCLTKLLSQERVVFLEVGPGKGLSSLISSHSDKTPEHSTFSALKGAREEVCDLWKLETLLSEYYLSGGEIDFKAMYRNEKRQRISLPGYAFDKNAFTRFFNMSAVSQTGETDALRTSVPQWKKGKTQKAYGEIQNRTFLILTKDPSSEVIRGLSEKTEARGAEVKYLVPGNTFQNEGSVITINPHDEEEYALALKELEKESEKSLHIVHAWNLNASEKSPEEQKTYGLYPFLYLAKALDGEREVFWTLLTTELFNVTGFEEINRYSSLSGGALKALASEYKKWHCSHMDLCDRDLSQPRDNYLESLVQEMASDAENFPVAFRGRNRFIQTWESIDLKEHMEETPLKEGGIYLITGGMGGMGYTFSRSLSEKYRARLVLTTRRSFPSRNQWDSHVSSGSEYAGGIKKIREIEALGGDVMLFSGDVSSQEDMERLVSDVKEAWGTIDGVIHTAGVADGRLISLRNREDVEEVLKAKVEGTDILINAVAHHTPNFILLCSSVTSLTGGFGQFAYTAANSYLDAFAASSSEEEMKVTAVNWPGWHDIGMLADSTTISDEEKLQGSISSKEGDSFFHKILSTSFEQAALSPYDIGAFVEKQKELTLEDLTSEAMARPELKTEYVAPTNETEEKLAAFFEEILGITPVGIHDDFFELGGHSLRGSVLISKISKEFGIKLSFDNIYQSPTVKDLYYIIDGLQMSQNTETENEEEREVISL